MKLPDRPRLLYLADPDFCNPYPSPLAGMPKAIESLGIEHLYLNHRTLTFESFRDQIGSFKPDLIFCMIQTSDEVEKVGHFLDRYRPVPAVNWNLEDPNGIISKHGRNLLDLSQHYDMWFGIDRKMLPYWKTKAAYLPQAFDESVFYDAGLQRDYAVSFIGQISHGPILEMYWPYMKELARYGKQAMLCIDRPMGPPLLPKCLEAFLRSKKRRVFLQRLPIWRCLWTNPQNEQEKAAIINRSRIHFGISRVRGNWEDPLKKLLPDYPLDPSGLFYQVKSRLFQAVGAGSMALTDSLPELEDMFEIGKEIVTFKFDDFEDLREKLAWYHAHPRECAKIAAAGYARARREHTYSARVRQLLDYARREL